MPCTSWGLPGSGGDVLAWEAGVIPPLEASPRSQDQPSPSLPGHPLLPAVTSV